MFSRYLSLLHNDFRIQPLDSMAAWDRWLNSLFPIQPLLTFSYVNNVLPILQANIDVNLPKNGPIVNSSRPFRFATASEHYA